MSDKHPNTNHRHGGPGSSHKNADNPEPEPARSGSSGRDNNLPEPGVATSGDSIHVSGGGERDKHHTHDPKTKV